MYLLGPARLARRAATHAAERARAPPDFPLPSSKQIPSCASVDSGVRDVPDSCGNWASANNSSESTSILPPPVRSLARKREHTPPRVVPQGSLYDTPYRPARAGAAMRVLRLGGNPATGLAATRVLADSCSPTRRLPCHRSCCHARAPTRRQPCHRSCCHARPRRLVLAASEATLPPVVLPRACSDSEATLPPVLLPCTSSPTRARRLGGYPATGRAAVRLHANSQDGECRGPPRRSPSSCPTLARSIRRYRATGHARVDRRALPAMRVLAAFEAADPPVMLPSTTPLSSPYLSLGSVAGLRPNTHRWPPRTRAGHI